MQKIRKAIIPAAGFGTRFLPATKAMPKEMLPIVDKPTIQYIAEEILESGIDQILIISGHAKRAIEDHFDSSPELESHLYEHGKMSVLKEIRKISSIKIHYVRQQYMRGLGDAILCAKDFVDGEPFGVILGDDVVYHPEKPALKQLMEQYEQTGGTVIGCQCVAPERVSAYGIIAGKEINDKGLLKVDDMIEKPSISEAPSRVAALGRYVITQEVFEVLDPVFQSELHLQSHDSGNCCLHKDDQKPLSQCHTSYGTVPPAVHINSLPVFHKLHKDNHLSL